MLSVAVMAHRKREAFVPGLMDQLGGCEVVWDRYNDRHETGLRAIRAYDPRATHHLIVQDDAVLCRDFKAGVEKLVTLTGDHPVALYHGNVGPTTRFFKAVRQSAVPRFVADQGPHWGVAIVLPTAHIDELAEWYEENVHIPNYDRRIARWYKTQRIDCWYTAPSLVQHRSDNPSLVPGRNGGRQAAWFIGEDQSALDVEWDPEPWIPPPYRLTQFVGPHGRRVTLTEGTPRFRRYLEHPSWVQIGED